MILMYSAPFSLWASAPTCYVNQRPWLRLQDSTLCSHDEQIQWTAKWPREEACHTREGISVMPRAKPEGETQAGNPPMRRGPGRQDYSRLKTAGRGTRITDHSCPPLYTPQPQSPGWPTSWPLDKGRGGGITWVTAESQSIERPLGW